MSWTLTIRTDSTLGAVRRAAAVFREAICGVGTSEARSELELAFVEACTNSAKHGSRGRADAVIFITTAACEARVGVVIEDGGRPFDAEKQATEVDTSDIASLPTGGMGLSLIREIFDVVKNEPVDGRNRLVLEKRLDAL